MVAVLTVIVIISLTKLLLVVVAFVHIVLAVHVAGLAADFAVRC